MSLAALREALKKETLTFGTQQTLRKLQAGDVKVIFFSADCNKSTKEHIHYYASLGKVTLHDLTQKSQEIAHICKKNYPVSVLSY